MKKNLILLLLIPLLLSNTVVYAHPGRTDSDGGHTDSSTGTYHYHHGYSAHQHPNGICPYGVDVETDDNEQTNQIPYTNSSDTKDNTTGVRERYEKRQEYENSNNTTNSSNTNEDGTTASIEGYKKWLEDKEETDTIDTDEQTISTKNTYDYLDIFLKIVIFVIIALLVGVLFRFYNNLEKMLKYSNFSKYQREKYGSLLLFFSLILLGILLSSLRNIFIPINSMLLKTLFGIVFIITCYLLSQLFDNIIDSRLSCHPSKELHFKEALESIGIEYNMELSDSAEHIPLEYGELIIFEYCDTKLFCEKYSNGIVHSIFYFSKKSKYYVFSQGYPVSDISDWKKHS